jgi:hypothetical protein
MLMVTGAANAVAPAARKRERHIRHARKTETLLMAYLLERLSRLQRNRGKPDSFQA